MTALRREIHRHPETAWHEQLTAALVRRELTRLGIPFRPCGGETGTLAVLRGAREGKTILLRADIDALSAREETGCPFASEEAGVMHACGHDGHTAMLLGAAMVLAAAREELPGTVVLAFQPAEEVAEGARAMIADGALEGVDACFGMHLMAGVPAGKILIPDGPVLSSADRFRIHVTGVGGHASQPHRTVDALVASAAIMGGLQTIVSREIDPQESAVVTVGRMEAGTLFNSIAASGELEGTVRTYSDAVQRQMADRIRRVAERTAEAYRAKASCAYENICPATVNDPRAAERMRCACAALFGPETVERQGRLMISEDFSEFAALRPSAFALVGIYDARGGAVYPNHSGCFTFDESVLARGAALFAGTALDVCGG